MAPDDLDSAAVEDLIIRGERRAIPSHPLRRSDDDRSAAVSGSLNRPRLDRLLAAGVGTIICGANQPIRETCLSETATQEYADANFLIVPDMVGSLGMARSFYHLMDRAADHSVAGTFRAVSQAIAEFIQAILECQSGGDTGLLTATLQVADARRGQPDS